MRVYISGKIGEEVLSEATREKFDRVAAMLRGMGYEVFNPVRSGLGLMAENMARATSHSFYREILSLDLHALNGCDIIYMLPDWQESPGARVELAFAQAVGMKVIWGANMSFTRQSDNR